MLAACQAAEPAPLVVPASRPHALSTEPSVAAPAPIAISECKHAPVVRDCSDGWCKLPAGCFWQGSLDDEYARAPSAEERRVVHLTHDILMQAHEVTRKQWLALGLRDPMTRSAETCRAADCPLDNVTWFEAAAFANLLSARDNLPSCYVLEGCTGKLGEGLHCQRAVSSEPSVYACRGYRLPTDAEWEYAARAGTSTAYFTGQVHPLQAYGACEYDEALSAAAWYCHNAEGRAHPVGQRAANGFGLYDTAGNVAEWVSSWTSGRPPANDTDPGALLDDAAGPHEGRTYRGGNYQSWSTLCRASFQNTGSWHQRAAGIGFRLVRTQRSH